MSRLALFFIVALGSASCGGEAARPALVADDPALAPIAWLTGSWLNVEGDAQTEEQWGTARGGTMLGTNRTVQGGATVHHEHLMIALEGGVMVYHATPRGQPPAAFRASSIGADRAVFEAPEHDFPQRITYERRSADAMVTRVEGAEGGAPKSFEQTWARVTPACAPAP